MHERSLKSLSKLQSHAHAPTECTRKTQVSSETWRHSAHALLSCPVIWPLLSCHLRHRPFSSGTVIHALFHAKLRSSLKGSRSGTPCTLPGSSTALPGCTQAAFEPSRHMSLSDSRGSITGIRAWSSAAGHRQDIVLPVFLVCTIPLPLARTSFNLSATHPRATGR